MSADRCAACGNTIADWANGVCQRCLMIDQERRRFGTNRPTKSGETSTNHASLPAAPSGSRVHWQPDIRRPASAPAQKQPELGLRLRLEAINRLLADGYGVGMRLSTLLQAQGVSVEQITAWQRDHLWLLRLVKAWVTMLLLDWSAQGFDTEVLDRWYGFTQKQQSALAIGTVLGYTPFKVRTEHARFVNDLRSDRGRHVLEQNLIQTIDDLATDAE